MAAATMTSIAVVGAGKRGGVRLPPAAPPSRPRRPDAQEDEGRRLGERC
jgi:hypothetical protein